METCQAKEAAADIDEISGRHSDPNPGWVRCLNLGHADATSISNLRCAEVFLNLGSTRYDLLWPPLACGLGTESHRPPCCRNG